jgi:hypothetical protein
MLAPYGFQGEPYRAMRFTEWLDLDTLRILSRHASGVIGAMAFFKLIAWFVEWGVPEGKLRLALELIDGFALVGLFLWLVYQMGMLLWQRRVRNGSALCLVIA